MLGWKQKNFREMLDNMPNGLYFVDLEGKIQYWNTTSEVLTGYAAKEIRGKPFDKTPIRYEDNRGNALQLYEHPVTLCLQKRQPVSKNICIRTKDNNTIHIEENATPLYKKNKMIGVVSTFRD
ncbi:MAG: PAS domain-containing protein, partial [Thermodesulfovibrionia bacterium]|nr:PAS domain-containing protein [Thermodesulfovibrionia bacterium]